MGLTKTKRNFCEGERQKAEDLQGKSGGLDIQTGMGCFPKEGLAREGGKHTSCVVRGHTFSGLPPVSPAQPLTLADSPSPPRPRRLALQAQASAPFFALGSLPSGSHLSFTPAPTAVCCSRQCLISFRDLGISTCLPLISAQKLNLKL